MSHDQDGGLTARLFPGRARPQANGPFRIGVLAGEGIGPEIIGVSLRLLELIGEHSGCRFEFRHGGRIGLEAERESGRVLTPEVLRFCADTFDAGGAILCGPGGGRFVYELRTACDLFCKLVPLKPLPALSTAGVLAPRATADVDILVIRENLGGVYQGHSGQDLVDGRTRAWHHFEYHEDQVDRLLKVAIRAAGLRQGRLCVVTKPAGVPHVSELWQARAAELVRGTGVDLRHLEFDNACYQLVAEARKFDVVAAPNMFGDALADGAGVLLGSRGMSFSANYSPDGHAVYQTGHGAAYDLRGTDRANPVGQLQSVALMLAESFCRPELAAALLGAVNDTLAAGWRTPDIMAPGCTAVGTRELGERIAATLDTHFAAGPLRVAAGER